MLTLLIPLCKVQMDWSRSTMSPKVYGKAGPFAMADATADFRKSIVGGVLMRTEVLQQS